jgi:hypothetical protein
VCLLQLQVLPLLLHNVHALCMQRLQAVHELRVARALLAARLSDARQRGQQLLARRGRGGGGAAGQQVRLAGVQQAAC